jgi:hypothetical protein
LNKECHKAKTFFSAKHLNIDSNRINSNDLDNPFGVKKINKDNNSINNLLEEINNLKNAIKKEEEKNIIFSYTSKYRNNYIRKHSQSINAFNIFNNSNQQIFKKKLSLINNNPNKRKLSEFNLITEVNKNKKKLINNSDKSILYSEEKINDHKSMKIPGSEKLKKEIKLYFSKNDKKKMFENLKASNVDVLEKIGDIKRKIRKKDILSIHNNYLNFSRAHNNKIKLIRKLEKKICNLDKVLIQRTIGKSFEDT